MWNVKRALVLAPHTDDGELGCGGLIGRLVEAGAAVHYTAFSICEISVPPPFPEDILDAEVREATAELGIPPEHLTVHRYPVRRLAEHRQEILEELALLNGRLQPDLVLLPSSHDVHQDHQVVNEEGIRAFKRTTILGYELPWNNLRFEATAIVPLEERHLQRKIAALAHYRSQHHRSYVQADYLRSIARVRGQQTDAPFAEAFQVIRWVLR